MEATKATKTTKASRACRECQISDSLKILGTGAYNDTIEVECTVCGELYEVEPDGLGEGGLEMVDAMSIEFDKDPNY